MMKDSINVVVLTSCIVAFFIIKYVIYFCMLRSYNNRVQNTNNDSENPAEEFENS
jgi:hypothetical protein